jgi:hypothetical protein
MAAYLSVQTDRIAAMTLYANIALIDKTAGNKVGMAELSRVAASLTTQVNRDLHHWWPVKATVLAVPATEKLPVGTWPIHIVDALPPGEGGYHWQDGHNQPYAEVEYGQGWTVAASHELCEMVIDPAGNRLMTARSIVLDGGAEEYGLHQYSYLIEVCDPCEAAGYTINGVAVSDFVIPQYYHTGTKDGRYSYTGAIVRPLQVIGGGYLSWYDPASGDIMQFLWVNPNQPPTIQNLGSANGARSLKEFVDNKTLATKHLSTSSSHPSVELAKAMADARK